MTARVLYIAGWGRSGSTLLDRLLGQMDGTVSVGEMRDVWERGVRENRLCGCGRPFLECPMWTQVGQCAFGGWDRLDLDEVIRLRQLLDRPWFVPFLVAPRLLPRRLEGDLREYARLLAALYAAIDEVNQGRVIVDSSKIPSFALILRLAGVRLRALHLVRDSRGVIHSWRKQVRLADATDGEDFMRRYGVASACVRYLMYNGMSHLLAVVGLPYRRLRYEDLVAEPAATVSDIAGFAGVRPSTGLLAELERRTLLAAPTHTVDGNPMRLDVGSIAIRADEGWRTGLPARHRRLASVLTAVLLAPYGYLGHGRRTARTSARPQGARA